MREIIPTDQSEYMGVATQPTSLANQTSQRDRKTEIIIRLGRKGKYTIEEIAKLTFSGTLKEDLFSDTLTHASKLAMQDTLRHTPIKESAFKSYLVWVIGVVDQHGIEIDLS